MLRRVLSVSLSSWLLALGLAVGGLSGCGGGNNSDTTSGPNSVSITGSRATLAKHTLLFALNSRSDGSQVASGTFDYGDGSSGTSLSHTYMAVGTYTAKFSGTDTFGRKLSATYTVAVYDDKIFPAALNTDAAPVATWPVAFTAKVTDLPLLAIASSSWNFGDGSTDSTTPIHTYATPGTYTVTFTGTDSQGRTNITTKTVTVADASTVTPFNVTLNVAQGANDDHMANYPITMTAAASDGSTLAAGVWDYGDGVKGSDEGGHTYDTPGTYTATYWGRDSNGRRGTQTATVHVDACTAEGMAAAATTTNPTVCVLNSQFGAMVFELDKAKAPISTANFLQYVRDKAYTLTLYHRVVDTNIHLVQAGGYTSGMVAITGLHAPIANESTNGLKNLKYTLGMARLADPQFDSATSQFYINTQDNPVFDYVDASQPGYAVFGKVIYGMDVADLLGKLSTSNEQPISPVGIYGMAIIHE